MRIISIYILSVFFLLTACERKYDAPTDSDRSNTANNNTKVKFYVEQYDPISDKGQYWHPDMMKTLPVRQYVLYRTGSPDRNDPTLSEVVTATSGNGLQYHLLSQSLSGLNAKAVTEGGTDFGTWMDGGDGITAYKNLRSFFSLPNSSTVFTGTPLLAQNFIDWDGGMIDAIGRGYVLTDVANNPESSVVAVVASHVHNAIIIDKRDQANFDPNGYSMVYDASTKTTLDSWNEFKDKCNNRGLVVMPAHTGELADFAIANDLFVVNLNKVYNTSAGGQNVQLFKDVLAWLQPNSAVYGWEPGVGEDEFVNLVSKSGNMMVAIHEMNLPYFAHNYKARQKSLLAKVVNPQDIDYSIDKKFVSFYLSDGPHTGWMMNGFVEKFYTDPNVAEVNMSFGVTASNISMVDPLSFERIMNLQKRTSTLIESFGGGYWYSDDFGISGDRTALLDGLAKKVAAHMRQHRIKVLEQIAHDPKSPAAKETYQAFVDANDQLEGIIAIQYAPSYAECGGDIMWVTNKKGYDIPVITVRYSIWNMGGRNAPRDGTPTYVANKLNNEGADSKFSSVIIHAWSNFKDTGTSNDELAENDASGPIRGASAAEMCARRLDQDKYEVINTQEMIWRVRMHYRSDQTNKYLSEYY